MKCTACDRHQTCSKPCVFGQRYKGEEKPTKTIMVINDFILNTDNRVGRHLGGYSRKLWHACLNEFDIGIENMYFTSLVKCSTPSDIEPMVSEVKACSDNMLAEIEALDPDIIVPTGNLALKFLKCGSAITKSRGKLDKYSFTKSDGTVKEYTVFPIVSPTMVAKQPKHMDMFVGDVDNLSKLIKGEKEEGENSFRRERTYADTYESAIAEIKRMIALPKGSIIVFDLETIKTNPFIPKVESSDKVPDSCRIPLILGIGLSDREGYGCSIPLFHRENTMTSEQVAYVCQALHELFSQDFKFTAHNGKFDQKWLHQHLGIDFKLSYDTMLMHYVTVTENKGTHGLKDLAWKYTDMGGYDDILDDIKPTGIDEGNYGMIDWDILKLYLADDADCTFRLLNKLLPGLSEGNFQWIHENLMMEGSECLKDIEIAGAFFNQERYVVMRENYEKEIERLTEKLYEYPEVLEIEREAKARWSEREAIKAIAKTQRTPEQEQKFKLYTKYNPAKGGTKFNFGSIKQLQDLLFNRMGLETDVYTEKGAPSTNDDSLKYMQKQHDICKTLLEFRKVNHLYNNFIVPFPALIDEDSLVHSTYHLIGTETGRLSSSNPE